MTFNFCIKDNISFFWNIEDEKNFDLKTSLIYDYPKDLYKESLDNIIPTYKAEGNNYHNNQTIYDIPEFLIEKKTTSNLTKRNTSSLYFSYENIINVLKESNDLTFNIYIKKLENCKNNPELKEIEYEMKILKKERKKYGENVGIKKNNPKLKLGRKKAIDQPERKHNKKSADNIIKKVKGYLLEFLITFVNGIINKKEYTLKPLDYKSNIDKMKKDEDIKLLDKTVKDYLYQDISRKYFKTPINWNKQIINHLLKDQKDNEVIN